MKKLLVIVALFMVSTVAINAQEKEQAKKQTRKEKKAEKKAILETQTKQIVDSETWYFDAKHMNPAKGQSRSLMNYRITIKDGVLDSYLPYMGRAYSAGYDGLDSPLIFEAQVENYTVEETKKGGYLIKFKVKNQSDTLEYSLNVSKTGGSSLSVQSSKRQHISYFGDLVPFGETQQLANN